MIGQANYHRRVPRDVRKNLMYRSWLLKKCRNRKVRAGVVAACRADILFYINSFVWQQNPRKKGREVGPFITWDFQEDSLFSEPHPHPVLGHRTAGILWALQHDEDILIEKSRELGATWWMLIVQDWLCRFHRNKNFIDMSHSEKAVDSKDDINLALFPKLEFINDHLPRWMPQIKQRKLGINYPMSRSRISGTSTTDKSSVGGRASGMFLDEFSKQTDDFAILGNTADVSCRVFNGTHYGTGTAFHALTMRPDLLKIIWHWSMHPDKKKGLYRYDPDKGHVEILDKNYAFPADYRFVMTGEPSGGPFPFVRSPWYDRECDRRMNKRDVAMHLDIDPQGSVSQVFDALVIQRLKGFARDPVWEGDLDYDRDLGIPHKLVERKGGLFRMWLNPDLHGNPPADIYTVGADISTGQGATASAATVFRVSTGEKVLEYANSRIDPKGFGVLLVALARLFKTVDGIGAKLVWEIPGPGLTTGARVVELGYLNIHFRTNDHDLKRQVSTLPGWPNQPDPMLRLIEEYRDALTQRRFVNYSERALSECLNFRYAKNGYVEHANFDSNNDPSGARINHADRVIPDALCWMLAKDRAGSRSAEKKLSNDPPVGSLAWRRKNVYDKRQDDLDSLMAG